jgi:hypothetical protein
MRGRRRSTIMDLPGQVRQITLAGNRREFMHIYFVDKHL